MPFVLTVSLLLAPCRGARLDECTPDSNTLAGILKRENHGAQKHMLSVTRRKPGFVRWFS